MGKRTSEPMAIPSRILIAQLKRARAAIDEALAPFEPVGKTCEDKLETAMDLKPGDSVFVKRPDNTMQWPGWFPDMEHLTSGIYEIQSLHSCQIDTDSGRINGLGVILDGEEHLLNATWLAKVGT